MGECFFWYRPTRVVPDQRPLNGRCCCCCVYVCVLIAATKPDGPTGKRKSVMHDFKLSADGRLVITDDSMQQGQ